jgi:hypothetical protein
MSILKLTILTVLYFLINTVELNAQNNLEALVAKCKKSVFSITTYDKSKKPIATGTGFFIDSKGTCISNFHVVQGASTAEIKTISGKVYAINNIISQSEKMDLIKFSISNPNNFTFPFLNLSQNKAKEGEAVFVIGNPVGLDFSVSNGIVSSLRNDAELGQLIQMTAPISAGNSGSPLINMKGEAIGVVSFTLLEGQNLNFAVSVSNLFLLDELGKLNFPPAKVKISNSNEKDFKRFEWKTSSSTILNSEKLTLYEKKGSTSDEFSLFYLATLGNIDLSITYSFKYDQLISISINPIRKHPKAIASDNRKITDVSIDFNSAYNEFATLELKLMELVGQTYYECVGGIPYFCSDREFTATKNYLNTKQEVLDNAMAYFREEKGNGFGYSRCYILNKWLNEGNNSIYTLGFLYKKEKQIINGKDWQCDWYLFIKPIQ